MVDIMLNRNCYECKKLNNGCEGVERTDWIGCLQKEADKNKIRLMTKLKMFELLEKRAGESEAEYANDPMNAEKEEIFDICYKQEYDAYISLANTLVEFTKGKIDFDTAKKMIQTKRTELLSILSM